MGGNEEANLHESLKADPVQIIAKSKSSTCIDAVSIKVEKPEFVSPSNERNKNSDKENENKLAILVYGEGNDVVDNINRVKSIENSEGTNGLEKDNRLKRTMGEQNRLEEDAKLRKLDQGLYLIQDCSHLKFGIETSNAQKEDDRDIGSVSDPGISDMINTVKESRERYPLPELFFNLVGCPGVGNCMVMLDNIGPGRNELDVFGYIPPGLRPCAGRHYVHSNGSNHYGFVHFSSHDVALSFMDKFNGVIVSDISFTYKLSWAPIVGNRAVMDDESEGDEDGPRKNYENDKQVDNPKALKAETVAYCDEVDSEETALRQFFDKLDAEAHIKGSPFWKRRKEPKIDTAWEDDGVTRSLVLTMVDAAIKKEQIMRVFGKHGDCCVDLPPGGGWATVSFNERSSAISAYEALDTVLEESGICLLNWGTEYPDSEDDESALFPYPLPCYICGKIFPKDQKLAN